jgi:hypothetical protein
MKYDAVEFKRSHSIIFIQEVLELFYLAARSGANW